MPKKKTNKRKYKIESRDIIILFGIIIISMGGILEGTVVSATVVALLTLICLFNYVILLKME